MAYWQMVIWSDETKINFRGSDGVKWKWDEKNKTEFSQRCVEGTFKFGKGCIMVWGCMTWDGVGELHLITQRMDARCYANILENELIKTITNKQYKIDEIIFQHDNDPKHTSKLARE